MLLCFASFHFLPIGTNIVPLSKGNKQKIGVCSALITNPRVLVLDEPFNGLDPTSQILLKRILENYNKNQETTIILSSHDLNYVAELATRIMVIEKGLVICDLYRSEYVRQELEDYFTIE